MSNSADSETFRFMARILADMGPQDVARLFAAASPLPSNPAAPAITSSPTDPPNSNQHQRQPLPHTSEQKNSPAQPQRAINVRENAQRFDQRASEKEHHHGESAQSSAGAIQPGHLLTHGVGTQPRN